MPAVFCLIKLIGINYWLYSHRQGCWIREWPVLCPFKIHQPHGWVMQRSPYLSVYFLGVGNVDTSVCCVLKQKGNAREAPLQIPCLWKIIQVSWMSVKVKFCICKKRNPFVTVINSWGAISVLLDENLKNINQGNCFFHHVSSVSGCT